MKFDDNFCLKVKKNRKDMNKTYCTRTYTIMSLHPLPAHQKKYWEI